MAGRSACTAPRAPSGPTPSTATGTVGNSLPVALNDGRSRGGLAGSTAELDFVRGLLGYQTGVDPAEVSDLSGVPARAAPAAGHRGGR